MYLRPKLTKSAPPSNSSGFHPSTLLSAESPPDSSFATRAAVWERTREAHLRALEVQRAYEESRAHPYAELPSWWSLASRERRTNRGEQSDSQNGERSSPIPSVRRCTAPLSPADLPSSSHSPSAGLNRSLNSLGSQILRMQADHEILTKRTQMRSMFNKAMKAISKPHVTSRDLDETVLTSITTGPIEKKSNNRKSRLSCPILKESAGKHVDDKNQINSNSPTNVDQSHHLSCSV
eukprot:869007_1